MAELLIKIIPDFGKWHQNMCIPYVEPVPEGWAAIFGDISYDDYPNFPNGDVEYSQVSKNNPGDIPLEAFGNRNTIEIVTRWIPAAIPEPPEPSEPDPIPDMTTMEDLENAMCEFDTALQEWKDEVEDALCELDSRIDGMN